MNTKEIATLANVSRSTVSRVLNNYSNVPLETREKVEAVIREYGYTPNHFARNLAGKSSNIVAIFLADINMTNSPHEWIGAHSPYNMALLACLISDLKKEGYSALVSMINSQEDYGEMETYFLNKMVYGGIFVGFPYGTPELEILAKKEYNIVLVDQIAFQDDKEKSLKLLNCDNHLGGYNATKYLLSQGYTKILHLSGDNRLSAIERKAGYKEAMEEANNGFMYTIQGMYREDIAYREVKKYLKSDTPDAIFVANDIMALGAIRAIKEKGLAIPEDIGLIGFDNLRLSNWLGMGLTTMEIDIKEIALSAVNMLMSSEKSIHKMCIPQLVENETVSKKI